MKKLPKNYTPTAPLPEEEDPRDIPALPPHDYRGYAHDWVLVLRRLKLWRGPKFHGDTLLTFREWAKVLAMAEEMAKVLPTKVVNQMKKRTLYKRS